MGSFLLFVIGSLVTLLIWAIIAAAVMSWLVAFNVINLHNRSVRMIAIFLQRLTAPVLGPVQRLIPSLGGVDISPIIVLLVLQGFRMYLLPLIFQPIIAALG